MIQECAVRMCKDLDEASKRNENQLTDAQDILAMAIGSMSSMTTYTVQLINHGKPAEIMDMRDQCITRIQELLDSDPEPLPVISMPSLEISYRWPEAAVQQVMGTVGTNDIGDKKESTLVFQSDVLETIRHLSTTPTGDIIIGTWSDDDTKRNIYVYSRDGVKKHGFQVPGLQGMVVIPDGRIAATVYSGSTQEVRFYDLKGNKLQSFQCHRPGPIALNSLGHLIVTIGRKKIRTFTCEGTEIYQFQPQPEPGLYDKLLDWTLH